MGEEQREIERSGEGGLRNGRAWGAKSDEV